MSIISPICGVNRKKYNGIGSISITKRQKLELIETYYDFKRMGYSEVDSQQYTLKPFSSRPNLFDAYKKELLKLISKNDDYIKESLKKDRSILNKNYLKA
jgi:hypothetical protein